MSERRVERDGGPPLISFGIFDWLDRNRGMSLADQYQQRLRVAEYADEAGFWCYHVAEHHGTPLSMLPSPNIFLGAMAARTSRIRLGPLVQILPLYHPVRIIEEICMLDNLTGGRLELGVGRGSSDAERSMYGIDAAQSRAMFQESFEIVLAGLAHGSVTYEGDYYQVKNVSVPLEPLQRPYPPLWYPTSNPDSVPWIGEQGFNTLFSFTFPSLEQTVEQVNRYRDSLEANRHNADRLNGHVAHPRYGFNRHIYVAETDAAAHEVARGAHGEFESNYQTRPLLPDGTPDRDRTRPAYDQALEAGMIFAGSPDTVRVRIQEYVDSLGANYVTCVFSFGNLTTEQILRSMRLFAEEVMPKIRPPATARSASQVGVRS